VKDNAPIRFAEPPTMPTRHLLLAAAEPPATGGAAGPSGDPMAALVAVLDAESLERLRELDPEGANGLLPRVLRAFDNSIERLLGQLAEARERGDAVAVRHVAHTLKSSSASVGALELSRICADIERRLRDQDSGELQSLLDDMVAQSRRVRAVLRPVLHDPR
jgi:HPt (histidine-containing phosphotransfer) domain-containing protein